MVEAKVPNRREGLPKGDECAGGSDYGACDDVPVMVNYQKAVKFLSVSRMYERTSDESYIYRW